jgi:hypothetical protein
MFDALSTHKPDSAPLLVGNDPPAVDLLFVDPSRTVEGLYERRLKGLDFKERETSHVIHSARA